MEQCYRSLLLKGKTVCLSIDKTISEGHHSINQNDLDTIIDTTDSLIDCTHAKKPGCKHENVEAVVMLGIYKRQPTNTM